MARGVKLAAVLFACLAVASGIPTQFPHGKTLVYNYYGDVKAGIIEPAPYASQYAIAGQLHIKHDPSDPKLPHAYYVALRNVKTGMHNGVASHFQTTSINSPIPDAAKVIEEPFLIINNEQGELQGVKFGDNEAGWSKNMKMAIATMLQLDMTNMKLKSPIKHHNFMSKEKTIQGECWTSYDVHAKLPVTDDNQKNFIVTKFSSPTNCTNYDVHQFDHVDAEQCDLPREAPVNMASRRVFDVEHQGDNILIKSLIAHGGTNYFPLKGRSEAHYVLNNASFVLDKIVSSSEIELPSVDFTNIEMTGDLSYKRPENNYLQTGAVDVTHGRHEVNQNLLVTIVKKMLGEAVDYLEEHHLDAKEPDFKHGQTINRILYNLGYLDTASLYQIYSDIDVAKPSDRDNSMKSIFLGVLPEVGTAASAIFVKDLILNKKLGALDTASILLHLPLNIRNPSEKLLSDMEGLINGGDKIPRPIRQSSILCFASMVYRTFKNVPNPEANPTLQKYLTQFYNHLIHDPSYAMKVTYLNAIRNVEVGGIVELLAPIIRGEMEVSENPMHLRLMAIWAINKAIANDYNVAHDLLWPIMADYTVPLKLRIAAYDILIRQAPTMTNILHIYWFMVYEKNEHLYNYHHTTIKGLANSVDPCDFKLRELTTKIMRFTRFHAPVSYALSSSYMADSADNIYGHGEKVKWSTTLSEVTGLPEVVHIEFMFVQGRKPVSEMGIHLHLEGFDEIFAKLMENSPIVMENLNDPQVLDVLKKAANDMPPMKKMHADVVLTLKGRVIKATHYNKDTLTALYNALGHLMESIANEGKMDKQKVMFTNIYEQQIISEMGLPIVMGTKHPTVSSLKVRFERPTTHERINLNFDLRLWRHGEYFMSIYNPMMDVWHSIKRSSAMDVSIPIRLVASINRGSVKFSFPILPAKKEESTLGIRMHAKDITTVTEDENNTLKQACPTCHHHEVVSNGPAAKKYYTDTGDSKDFGLLYTSSIFDCENEISPIHMGKEWLRSTVLDRRNSWNDVSVNAFLGIRQFFRNINLSPPMGSCGMIMKLEPSIAHPTSRLDISYRRHSEELQNMNGTYDLLKPTKKNIHGTMEAIAAGTNTTARSWDLNVNVEMSAGHYENSLKVQLTRKTPGEKDLKICIDGQHTYPPLPADALKLGRTRESTRAKLTLSVAHTDADSTETASCPRDESVISIIAKGELSKEQKKLFTHDAATGACKNDIENPLMKNPAGLVPRTVNCIDEAIRHTTLKQYAFDVSYKKVPEFISSQVYEFEDAIRAGALPNIEYTSEHVEPGTISIGIRVPSPKNDLLDVKVTSPSRSYNLIDVPLDIEIDPPRLEGFGPDYDKHLYLSPLDNTRFPLSFLHSYVFDGQRICTLFPKIALTLDGGKIPHVLSNNWTLALGNHMQKDFAIFVRSQDDKMEVKMFVEDRIISMEPRESGFAVWVDGNLYRSIEGIVYSPPEATSNYIAKVTMVGNEVIVQLLKNSMVVVVTANSVTMTPHFELQGIVSGLCGHMTGDYKTTIPKEYLLAEEAGEI